MSTNPYDIVVSTVQANGPKGRTVAVCDRMDSGGKGRRLDVRRVRLGAKGMA